jgi:hypothetical protein
MRSDSSVFQPGTLPQSNWPNTPSRVAGNNLPVFGNVLSAPEAIRGMIDAMLHILAKDPGEKPAKKAKIR